MTFLKKCITSVLIAFLVSSISTSYTIAGTFENYSSIGGFTGRDPHGKKPTSSIELTMFSTHGGSTAVLGDSALNYDTGEEGTFEQMLKRGRDFEENGFSSIYAEMLKKKKESEGEKIKIVFPMIDYGYSGTFNNIGISVTENDQNFRTAILDEYSGGVTSFTGSVTIEKYSRSTMKGSYSGSLHRYEDSNLPFRGPFVQVKRLKRAGGGSVSGEFTILNPWKGDDRITDNIDFQSAIVDPMKNDIKRLVDRYGIDIDVDKEFAKVNVNRNRNQGASGSSSSAATVYGDCNCSCNFIESSSTACKATCDDAFKVCEGERDTVEPTVVQNQVDTPPSEEELRNKSLLEDDQKLVGLDKENFEKFINNELTASDNLREKFIALLEKKQPGEKMAPARKMLLQGFDSMPDDNSRMMMYMSLEGSK